MKIYLTAKLGHPRLPMVAAALRAAGHELFNFSEHGQPSPREDLGDPEDLAVFDRDHEAMQWADALVLLLPGGRGAHLEAGWCAGAGKLVYVFDEGGVERPELMYGLCTSYCTTLTELIKEAKADD